MGSDPDTLSAEEAKQMAVSIFPLQSLRSRQRVVHGILHVVLMAVAFSFLVPLLWVASTSLKRSAQVFIMPMRWIPTSPQWQNYVEIFEILPLAYFIRNSAIVTVLGTAGSVVSSLFVAYSLARLRWPGRGVIFTVLLATMMLPRVVTMIPTFLLFKHLGWLDTFYPLFVPSWFGGAFYIFLVRQFMAGLPIEFDEAARMDGASSFWILWRVITPMCGPAIAAVSIFSFLWHYNNFIGPLLYLSSSKKFTLPLGIYWYQGRYGNFWHLVMAASMVSIVPVIILFFIAQRHFIQGIQLSGLTGR